MELSRDKSLGQYQITHYEQHKIMVNNEAHIQSIIISLAELIAWPPQNFTELKPEHFQVVLELQPEIVLLGTGAIQTFPSATLMRDFADKNIGVEVMTTAAACRTFNVLIAEGRNVVAALLIA